MILVKLGGSAITRKDDPETVDAEGLRRAATAVAGASEDVVVVHGAGSFGHHHADRHGLDQTTGSHDPAALWNTHGSMKELNATVIAALGDEGVAAAPVHPFSMAHRDGEGTLSMPTDHVAAMLDEGYTPVLHGDCVVHRGEGVTILSGDELIVELTRSLAPDRVGLCSTVSGVLRDGEVIDRIDSFEAVADVLGGSDATDVTGGMAGKVRRLLSLDAPATIFGPDDLRAFVDGERVGTVIDGRDR